MTNSIRNKPQQSARAHPDTSGSLFAMRMFQAERDLPIVYSEEYNFSILGLEFTHQFDTKKYSKLAHQLSDDFLDTPWARMRHFDDPQNPTDTEEETRRRKLRFLRPTRPISRQELAIHHTQDYIDSIHSDKALVARITEVWLLNLIPLCVIERSLLKSIKWQLAGSIFAAHLAMQHGWAINLGGGFHQSSANDGETFCLFSDVMLLMRYIWRKHPMQKFMIIDLDAHQATGLERDLADLSDKLRARVFMMDVYNNSIQPPDSKADKGMDLPVELGRFTGDSTYMRKLGPALEEAFSRFKPTLVIYIAGQDVLMDDQLGLMNLSDEALKRRDEMVFTWACERQKCPILMLLGGGYLVRGTKLQADSIRNLYAKGLIWGGHKSGSRTLSRPRHPAAKATSSTSNKSIESRSSIVSQASHKTAGSKHQVIKTSAASQHHSQSSHPNAVAAKKQLPPLSKIAKKTPR